MDGTLVQSPWMLVGRASPLSMSPTASRRKCRGTGRQSAGMARCTDLFLCVQWKAPNLMLCPHAVVLAHPDFRPVAPSPGGGPGVSRESESLQSVYADEVLPRPNGWL